MLTWAGASLPPQQGIPCSCPSESRTRHGGTSRGQVHPSNHKSVMAGTRERLVALILRFNTNSSRKPSRLIHNELAVSPPTVPLTHPAF